MTPFTFSKIIVFCVVFLGTNVLGYFGVRSSQYQTFLLVLTVFPAFFLYKQWTSQKPFMLLLMFLGCVAARTTKVDHSEGARAIVMSLAGAQLLFMAIPNPTKINVHRYYNLWKFLIQCVFFAFCFETGLSIFERILGHSTFGWRSEVIFDITQIGDHRFRSTALYGHPLTNALMVSTTMLFVLISSLKIRYKFFLWGVGLLSVLCFNTRSSIVINIVFLVIYLFHVFIFSRNVSVGKKMKIFAVAGGLSLLFFLLIIFGGLGGRLLAFGLMDDSAQVRLNAFDIFKYYGIDTFIWGLSKANMENIQSSMGINIIENFWIVYILRFGIVIMIPYVLLLFVFLKNILGQYTLFQKLFVTGGFYLIASSNNSLSSTFIPLFYFLVLTYLFSPNCFNQCVKLKYLEK